MISSVVPSNVPQPPAGDAAPATSEKAPSGFAPALDRAQRSLGDGTDPHVVAPVDAGHATDAPGAADPRGPIAPHGPVTPHGPVAPDGATSPVAVTGYSIPKELVDALQLVGLATNAPLEDRIPAGKHQALPSSVEHPAQDLAIDLDIEPPIDLGIDLGKGVPTENPTDSESDIEPDTEREPGSTPAEQASVGSLHRAVVPHAGAHGPLPDAIPDGVRPAARLEIQASDHPGVRPASSALHPTESNPATVGDGRHDLRDGAGPTENLAATSDGAQTARWAERPAGFDTRPSDVGKDVGNAVPTGPNRSEGPTDVAGDAGPTPTALERPVDPTPIRHQAIDPSGSSRSSGRVQDPPGDVATRPVDLLTGLDAPPAALLPMGDRNAPADGNELSHRNDRPHVRTPPTSDVRVADAVPTTSADAVPASSADAPATERSAPFEQPSQVGGAPDRALLTPVVERFRNDGVAVRAPAPPAADGLLPDELAEQLWGQVERALHRVRPTADGHELRLRLRPAELGDLTVRVRTTENGVTVQLVASNPAAQRTLESDSSRLQTELASAGFGNSSVDVGHRDPDGRADSSMHREPRGEGRRAPHRETNEAPYVGRPEEARRPRAGTSVDLAL